MTEPVLGSGTDGVGTKLRAAQLMGRHHTTAHLVNEVPDGGRILPQKAVDVLPDDTAESPQRRVMEQAEWVLLPQAAEILCKYMDGGVRFP